MYNIDFSVPCWLLTYYHIVGTISLVFDLFSIYLILFQSKHIDNFRFFLLNFQIACCFTDIHLTFLMQPIPLYPLVSGYVLGYSIHFGINSHQCMCVLVFCFIYQIASMITCFVRKHQAIAKTLKKYSMPNYLVFTMIFYVMVYTCSVTGIYSTLGVPDNQKMDFVKKNFPEYLTGFQSVPTFSIYETSDYFVRFVFCTLVGGIFAFLTLVVVILNIFRMLNILKTKISASTYQKHRTAVYSLLAQFLTSSVVFVPPILFVMVILIGSNGAQVIVDVLVMIACTHSTLNVVVLISTFPPYRKFVLDTLFKTKLSKHFKITAKPSPLMSHLGK